MTVDFNNYYGYFILEIKFYFLDKKCLSMIAASI